MEKAEVKNGKRIRVVGEPLREWEPGRWWRVEGPDRELWCETSDEEEARESMRPGDTLYRLFEWRNKEFREMV